MTKEISGCNHSKVSFPLLVLMPSSAKPMEHPLHVYLPMLISDPETKLKLHRGKAQTKDNLKSG